MFAKQQAQAADPSISAQQRTMIDRIITCPVATTEAQIRKDLTVAHRLMARYSFDDLCWNRMFSFLQI
jgi:polyhydroxyalkanoate synthesis regulator protein